MVAVEELAGWILGVAYPLLLLIVFILAFEAKDCAKERERYFQEMLRLEERLHQERMRLAELRNWLKALHQEHSMIREDMDSLRAAIEELKKEKCKIVEVVNGDTGR